MRLHQSRSTGNGMHETVIVMNEVGQALIFGVVESMNYTLEL